MCPGRGEVGSDSLTLDLCQFLADAEFSSLSAEVRQRAKLAILDSVACAVGGSVQEPSRILEEVMASMGGPGHSTVLGTRRRLPVLAATHVNSAHANALDFDDTELGHPGATVVPPALAVGEYAHSSGQELLLAIVLGYEVGLRVGSAIRPTAGRWRQVAGSSTYQVFGAVASASKLLHLDHNQTAHAFGLAGSSGPVPAIRKFGSQDGGGISWLKNNYGVAGWQGVLAAELARKGFRGPETILDGERGFWVMAGSDCFEPLELTRDLGSDWRIMRVSFKPYPCCRFLHAAVDGVRSILSEHDLGPGEIDEITVASVSHVGTFMNRPLEPLDGQFSLPHVLALTALGVPPGLRWLSSEVLHDAQAAALAGKVRFVLDPEAEAHFVRREPYETTVRITTGDARYEARVRQPSGHPANPLSPGALSHKYYDLVNPVWGEERAAELFERVSRLEECADVASLFG